MARAFPSSTFVGSDFRSARRSTPTARGRGKTREVRDRRIEIDVNDVCGAIANLTLTPDVQGQRLPTGA